MSGSTRGGVTATTVAGPWPQLDCPRWCKSDHDPVAEAQDELGRHHEGVIDTVTGLTERADRVECVLEVGLTVWDGYQDDGTTVRGTPTIDVRQSGDGGPFRDTVISLRPDQAFALAALLTDATFAYRAVYELADPWPLTRRPVGQDEVTG